MLLPRLDVTAGSPAFARPWPSVLVTWGPGGRSGLHAHHCWHLIVGVDGELGVPRGLGGEAGAASEAERALERCAAVLTGPDVPHAVDAAGTFVVITFVEPESDFGARLAGAFDPSGVTRLADVEELRALFTTKEVDQSQPEDLFARTLDVLRVTEPGRVRGHPGVRRVLRFLKEAPPSADVSLEALAGIARLSPGRFMHAFTETVGVPLRPYLRWLKVERAAFAIASGVPLSAAAHDAGFSDAAHMTRTFHEMFGVTPSELRRRGSQSVQD